MPTATPSRPPVPISEAAAYLKESLSAFTAHGLADSGGVPECEVRHALHGDHTVIVQLWQPDHSWQGSATFWDGLVATFEAPDQVTELLGHLARGGVKSSAGPVVHTPATREPLPIPMYQYHPQRFRAVVPIAKSFAQAAPSEVEMFTMEAMQFGAERYRASQNLQTPVSPLRALLKLDPRGPQKLIQAAMFFGDFTQHGRQIFDFPAELASSFRRSDVEDIPLAALKLPYESFYVHFGAQLDLETAPGWHPDGAYVVRVGDIHGEHVIQFCLTSVPADQATYEDWLLNPEPFYIQAVPSAMMTLGVGEAVNQILSDKIARLTQQAAAGASGQQAADQALHTIQAETGGAVPIKRVHDISVTNAQVEIAALPELHRAWREMLNLVVNGIAYLTRYNEDVRTQWPARVPAELMAQSTAGTPKQKLRARSKLAALGYTAVHLCGTKFVEMADAASARGDAGPDAQKQPTWVRGTWVWQAHGPKWSQRRLQWRMPHIRNKDTDEAPASHLYLVD